MLPNCSGKNVTWRRDLLAALRLHPSGKGGRGVADRVAAAIADMDTQPAQPRHATGAAAATFEPEPLGYMHLLILGLVEWPARMGHREAPRWLENALQTFPAQEAWQEKRRCTAWALLDTTALFIISTYIRKLPAPQALLTVVVGTVIMNSWRSLQATFGADGIPLRITALMLAELRVSARKPAVQTCARRLWEDS